MNPIAEALELIDGRINLAFHDLEDSAEPSPDRYTLSMRAFDTIADWLATTGLAPRCRLYFDDNHESCHQFVVGRSDLTRFDEIVIGVPAVSVDEPNYGDRDALDRAAASGITISAHGYQHVRLASYTDDGALLDTPLSGPYQPVPADHESDDVLAENQVLYQLVESYEALARFAPKEFVLPYGCFNRTTVAINDRLGLYETLATSDFDLDVGQALRPRLLVEATTTPDELEATFLRRIGAVR